MLHGRVSPSSGISRLKCVGTREARSSSINAAPLFDMLRTLHGILSPPFSISADFAIRKRGCDRVPTIVTAPSGTQNSKGGSFSFRVLDKLFDAICLRQHTRPAFIILDVTDKVAHVEIG
jgi:hypothetical protein